MDLYSKIEGAGKPLLILHGFLGMSDNWKTLGSKYAQNGFAVHMPDLRNHGRSFHSDEFTYEVMADDLFRYCQKHNLSKVSIIGHSMGGKVAMFFAISHPEMVDKLIIADIGTKYYEPHHADIMQALNAADLENSQSRDDIEQRMQPHVSDFGTRQFLLKNVYRKTPTEFAFRFNLELFNREIDQIGEALPPSAVYEKQVLFLRGEKSKYIVDEDIANIQKHFPAAEFKVVPNGGHWLHAENPDDFLSLSLDFLN